MSRPTRKSESQRVLFTFNKPFMLPYVLRRCISFKVNGNPEINIKVNGNPEINIKVNGNPEINMCV